MTPEKVHEPDTPHDLVSVRLADFARYVTGSDALLVVDMMGTTPREVASKPKTAEQNED